MTKASARILCASVLGAIVLSCHSESKESAAVSSEQPQAAASAKNQDRLARAVASAIEKDTGAKTPQANDSAPPTDGVLEPSKADAMAPIHSPPKLNLGSAGSAPRVKVLHRAMTGPLRASLQLSVDLGNGQGIPPVDFKLELKSAAAATSGIQTVSARVISADMSVPNIPEELKAQLRKLKGSKFSMKVADNGGAFDCARDMASDKNPELSELLDMVAQGLLDAYVAVPNDEVGPGAYWMTTSRQPMFGMDWITYDMVKVNEIGPTGVKLEISTRRYVVGRDMPGPAQGDGQGTKLTIREAMASGSAQATAPLSANLLSSYERSNSVRMILDGGDNNGQRVLQANGQTKFAVSR